MFCTRILVAPDRAGDAMNTLRSVAGVTNIVMSGVTADGGLQVISADVRPDSADEMFDRLEESGVDSEAVTLVRQAAVGPVARRLKGRWFAYGADRLVWAEAVDTARENAVLTSRYCLYMVAAAVIATYGIILRNSILVVGAMAVSPDLMPLSAFSIGVVGRRPRLAVRGLGVLTIGMAIVFVTSATLSWLLRAFNAYNGLLAAGTALAGIVTSVSSATIMVAFVAGVVGMLAFQTRASVAVGVAISVTTIPAAAFAGVALGIADTVRMWSALEVLGVNILMLFVGGVLTLLVQRRLGRRYR